MRGHGGTSKKDLRDHGRQYSRPRPRPVYDWYLKVHQRSRQVNPGEVLRCQAGLRQFSTLARRELASNWASDPRQKPELTMAVRIRTSALTCGNYRTSSRVTALPMITRWISDVPSKMVKLVEVRAVSAGRWSARRSLVSAKSAPMCRPLASDLQDEHVRKTYLGNE